VAVQLDDLQNELGGAGETPRDCAERRQARECLAAALARLDERQLMVLNMYYQDGLTLREIGQILGVSESRVCQIHTGALRALRAQLN
jgi:RNA polymerase sigma factor for flagellar operon FliA